MNKQLAYFSIALGAVELMAPNLLSRSIGLEPKPGMMRALGLREIATGLGMLSLPGSPAGPGARVAGDAMDLAVIGLGAGLGRSTRGRRLAALLAVAGVMALDIYATKRATGRRRAVARFKRQSRVAPYIPTLAAASPH
ncbi:MAG TPA: hypothetical protein VFZ95_11705 [Steroidobacteraceae bacterium]